jgi:hypothetical protein
VVGDRARLMGEAAYGAGKVSPSAAPMARAIRPVRATGRVTDAINPFGPR